MASKRSKLACDYNMCQFTADTAPKLRRHKKTCKYQKKACPHKEFGCKESILAREADSHIKSCVFQPVHCPVWGCEDGIRALEVDAHIRTEHKSVKIMPGPKHEILFKLVEEDVEEKPPRKETTCFPVCIQYDHNHCFYISFSRLLNGQWFAYVFGTITRNFWVKIVAIGKDGIDGNKFEGPVNHAKTLSTNRMNLEDFTGLNIPIRIVKDELLKYDGKDTVVEIKVEISHLDEKMNARAERWSQVVDSVMMDEVRRLDRLQAKGKTTGKPFKTYFLKSRRNFAKDIFVWRNNSIQSYNEVEDCGDPDDEHPTISVKKEFDQENGKGVSEDETSGISDSYESDQSVDGLEDDEEGTSHESIKKELKIEPSYKDGYVDFPTLNRIVNESKKSQAS